MADKRISQLVERVSIANNDVLPIVASGATTTNKVTISSIQTYMQENLDVGVTSVGITIGTSGTDVSVTGSPVTTSGNITINIPTASATNRGLLSAADWSTFTNDRVPYTGANDDVDLGYNDLYAGLIKINGTSAEFGGNLGFKHSNSVASGTDGYTSISTLGSTSIKFRSVSGSFIRAFSLSMASLNPSGAESSYTLPASSGTLALTSDLDGYVTLDTAQTITAQKTFTTSGSSDTMIISHGSGSGFALDVIKAGDGEAIRVQKTSGSGNAVTITGGLLSAEASAFSGNIAANGGLTLAAAGSADPTILRNTSGTTSSTTGSNVIGFNGTNNIFVTTESRGGFILGFNNSVSNREYTLPDASGTLALTSDLGAYLPLTGGTLTGALNGTSASFTDDISLSGIKNVRWGLDDGSANARAWGIRNGYNASGDFVVLSSSTNNTTLNTVQLQIARTGAATFSSSVNAKTFIMADTAPIPKIESTTGTNFNGLELQNTGGSFYIGQDSSAGNFYGSNTAYSGCLYNSQARPIVFFTTATERMRITSGGYLKQSYDGTYLGATSAYNEFTNNVSGEPGIITTIKGASISDASVYLASFETDHNNSTAQFFRGRGDVETRVRIYSNGGIANYQANNVNLSDERTKKDITPLESYWDKFKAIEIVKFKYKDQTHDDFNIGVIAQQVESVAPEFVDVDGWNTKPELDEEGNEIVSEEEPLKSIYTADLHHATIKVLQEAMAKIEELQIQIDSLKNQIK